MKLNGRQAEWGFAPLGSEGDHSERSAAQGHFVQQENSQLRVKTSTVVVGEERSHSGSRGEDPPWRSAGESDNSVIAPPSPKAKEFPGEPASVYPFNAPLASPSGSIRFFLLFCLSE